MKFKTALVSDFAFAWTGRMAIRFAVLFTVFACALLVPHLVFADENIEISVAGKLKAADQKFDGTAHVKATIIDETEAVRWSHDGTREGEPTSYFEAAVVRGSFTWTLGDETLMEAIPASTFSVATDHLYLILWVDAGYGFERMDPLLISASARAGNASLLGGRAASEFRLTTDSLDVEDSDIVSGTITKAKIAAWSEDGNVFTTGDGTSSVTNRDIIFDFAATTDPVLRVTPAGVLQFSSDGTTFDNIATEGDSIAAQFVGTGSATTAVDLATAEVSGVLPVANGGTGAATAALARASLGVPSKADIQSETLVYAADSGAADAYVVTLSPAPTAYTTGMRVNFKATNANTGTSTLNVNGLGVKTIKKSASSNLESGDIAANQIMSVIYDGTNFQTVSGGGGGALAAGDVTTTEILDGTIASVDIADATIAATDIASNTITAAEIATSGVTTAEILDATILTGDIAADTILAGNIATGAVATTEILDNTVTTTDLNATLTFADDDILDLALINNSDGLEGLILPQATDVSTGTAEGQIGWDTDNNKLYIGTGASVVEIIQSAGNVATATALAANGANCAAGQAPLGVDASGAVEGCFAVITTDDDTPDSDSEVPNDITIATTSTIASTNTNDAGASANPIDVTSTLGIMDGSDTYHAVDINLTNADHTGAGNVIYGLDISGLTGDAQATETAILVGAGWDIGLDLGMNTLAFTETGGGSDRTTLFPPTATTGDIAVNLPSTAGTLALTSGNVATSTALAANGANCAAGQYPLGVDASGAVESCTVAGTGTVTTVSTSAGITGGDITTTGTIALDYTPTLAGDPNLGANKSQFATTGLIFEGASNDGSELLLTAADPGADITLTLPATTGTVALTSGNVATATALAANGANCAAGQAPLGVDASGAVEGCFAVITTDDDTPDSDSEVPNDITIATTSTIASTNTNDAGASANPIDVTSTLGIMDGSDTYHAVDINLTNADHTGAGNVIYGLDISGLTGDAQATETAILVGAGWDIGLDLGMNTLAFTETGGGSDRTTLFPPTATTGDIAVNLPSTAGTLALTSGNVATATALAANGANCAAGQYPLGVDASGAVESCTVAGTGTVTTVSTSAGITGGDITTTGTIALDYTPTLAGDPNLGANKSQFATTGLIFEGASNDGSELLLTAADPGADITLTLPATTGTLALTSGNVATATALAANGANCAAGQAPLGVDASGAVEGCFAVITTDDDTPDSDSEVPNDITVASTAAFSVTGATSTFTLGSSNQVVIDAATTDKNTDSSPAFKITTDTNATNSNSLYIDHELVDDADATDNAEAALISFKNSSGDANDWTDILDLQVDSGSTGDVDAGLYIANNSASVALTDGIRMNPAANNGIVDAIDVSDTNITNAINVGANPIVTGNVAGTIGDATTDSWTFTTDGSGDAEIVLPTGAISTGEILDATVAAADLKAVDSGNDEECLTFETTTGDFEWQACGGGDDQPDDDSEVPDDITISSSAKTQTFTFGASDKFLIDAATTDNTGTAGVVDLNIDAGDAAVDGINLALTQIDGASAAVDATGLEMLLTGNDADGDVFGIKITGAATANATTGTYEAGIFIDNAENSASSMTDGILITASGANGGVVDAIDVSASNITNAINIGANNIITGAATIASTELDYLDGHDAALIDLNDSAVFTGALDAGGATSVEVPNGANPSVSTAGQVSVDTSATSGGMLRLYTDAERALPVYQSKSFTVSLPATTDDFAVWKTPYDITIRAIHGVVSGGTNVVFGLDECDANGANGAGIDGATDITATTTNANDDGTLSNPTVDANDYVCFHTTSVSGAVNFLTVTFEYTVDPKN